MSAVRRPRNAANIKVTPPCPCNPAAELPHIRGAARYRRCERFLTSGNTLRQRKDGPRCKPSKACCTPRPRRAGSLPAGWGDSAGALLLRLGWSGRLSSVRVAWATAFTDSTTTRFAGRHGSSRGRERNVRRCRGRPWDPSHAGPGAAARRGSGTAGGSKSDSNRARQAPRLGQGRDLARSYDR